MIALNSTASSRRIPFYGANRPGANVSQGVKNALWLWCMQVGLRAAYEGVKAFSETDFADDLKRFDVPTLIIHGEDDQNVPIENSAFHTAKLVPHAALKVYEKAASWIDGDPQRSFQRRPSSTSPGRTPD